MAAVLFFGGVLGSLLLIYTSIAVKKNGIDHAVFLWIMVIISAVFGVVVCGACIVPASDYLKSPENYNVDTFMVNGVIDHYQVSEKR